MAGREFRHDLLAATSGQQADELVELLEEALAAGIIDETATPGEYRFTHALVQESLLDGLSTVRQAGVHGRIGEALETLLGDGAEQQAAALAHHFVEAAQLDRSRAARALHYSKLAAGQAEEQSGWSQAARHYEHCLSLLAGMDDPPDEDEAELLVAAGTCYLHAADPRAAQRYTTRARDLFRDRGDAVGFARATLVTLRQMAISQDREQWRAPIDEALSLLKERDSHLRAELLVVRAARGLFEDEEGVRAEREAAELAKRHGFADIEARLVDLAAHRAWAELRLDDAPAQPGVA